MTTDARKFAVVSIGGLDIAGIEVDSIFVTASRTPLSSPQAKVGPDQLNGHPLHDQRRIGTSDPPSTGRVPATGAIMKISAGKTPSGAVGVE